MVLEVREAKSKGSINERGHFQDTEIMGFEVHVKDEARFPGKWAFFDFDAPDRTAPSFPRVLPATRATPLTQRCRHNVCSVLPHVAAHCQSQKHPRRRVPERRISSRFEVVTELDCVGGQRRFNYCGCSPPSGGTNLISPRNW